MSIGFCMKIMLVFGMLTWAYIAGFFDGEGHVSFARRNGGSSCIVVGMAQSQETGKTGPPQVLQCISAFLRDRGVRHNVYEAGIKQSPSFLQGRAIQQVRVSYHLQIQNRPGIQTFLEGVYPHLWVKKQKAEDAIRFLKLFPDMRGYFSNNAAVCPSVDLLKADRAQGLTYAAIAAKHGVKLGIVYRRLHLDKSRQQTRAWRAAQKA